MGYNIRYLLPFTLTICQTSCLLMTVLFQKAIPQCKGLIFISKGLKTEMGLLSFKILLKTIFVSKKKYLLYNVM